ncbi:hypothetical protein [Parafrankia sp. EUN1f]|uniref:hypothetical protein n=1 Tax=Parafrankia sp. EUN1f TaxID=102897 RepID=UPI000561B44A|nr:hypothetical protein [Parafrankia sp. EUN1f]
MVEVDLVEGSPGDLLGAVEDGLDGGAADEVGQAADHPAGALVEVAVERGERPGGVVVQAQGLLECGDEGFPLVGVGERGCFDQAVAAGDLPAAGAGEQAVAFDVDASEDEGRGDALGEVLQRVGDLGAGAGGQGQVVDLVDFTDRCRPNLPSGLR